LIAHTYGSIPKCAAQLQCSEEYRLGLLVGQVLPKCKADAHGTKTWNRDFHVCETQCFDHDCDLDGLRTVC
jgi:hypothetical protein